MTTIFTAIITACGSIIVGVLTLIGVIVTNTRTSRDIEQKIAISQAVTDTKLEELTREVREHNNFIQRMPVMEEQIRVVNHRISDLENLAS